MAYYVQARKTLWFYTGQIKSTLNIDFMEYFHFLLARKKLITFSISNSWKSYM